MLEFIALAELDQLATALAARREAMFPFVLASELCQFHQSPGAGATGSDANRIWMGFGQDLFRACFGRCIDDRQFGCREIEFIHVSLL